MTDELTPNPSTDDNQNKELSTSTKIDHILRFIASIVRSTNMEIGVTLYVKGIVVSGLAISPEQYFDGLAQEFEKAKGNQEVTQAFAKGFRTYRDTAASLRQESQDNKPDPVYIHLKNAKFISSVVFNPNDTGVYWRGRLDQVDGFSFGNI
jgi:hypothetical protein